MSRLEELIRELCPDGVEYKSLQECTQKIDNIKWAVASKDYQYIDLSSVDLDTHQIINTQIISADNAPSRAQQIVRLNDILLGTTRPMLRRYCMISNSYDGQICSTGFCVLRAQDFVLPQWIYHQITSTEFFSYVEKNQKGASYPSISDTKVKEYQIPVPPLPVQREIVRILDHFTELTSELTAELTARKKQYAYYRDKLLTQQKETTEMTLGDIGAVCMCKRIMKAETSSEGEVPFFKIGTFGKEPDAYITREKFDEYREKYSFPRKGDILISAAGTIGRTVIYDGKPAYYQDSNIVWLSNDESKVLNKYLFYYYQLQPWAVSTGGTIARLYNDNISKAKITVPSLEAQRRIVSILDRFDALCNDLTSGLPAEIEARKKQYEYYRDKLLSFKVKT